MSENGYSKLEFWEVWNFMSIKHAKCEFDERGIINIKGYNDSGKSAMLTALKVLLCNSNPAKQVSFITDDESYFRVIAKFDDGVLIMRDKYLNGQSVYEMYKDDKLVFTTKSPSGALTKVTNVPEPIEAYLGLINYEQLCINCRTRHDKLIGVENTGSENYKMFNAVLKSEEIARAGILLNSDKNRLVNDINAVDNELTIKKTILTSKADVTMEMIAWLKEHDSLLDKLETADKELCHLNELYESYSGIHIFDELSGVDNTQLVDLMLIGELKDSLNGVDIAPAVCSVGTSMFSDLQGIKDVYDRLSALSIPPELGSIDTTQFSELMTISSLIAGMNKIDVAPSVPNMDSSKLADIVGISDLVKSIASYDKVLFDCDEKLKVFDEELESLNLELEKLGVHFVTCPDCGRRFSPDEEHLHT